MASFTWQLQGTTPTTIDDTDKLQLAGSGGFDSKITVGEYNDTTHVKTESGTNKSSGNSPNNNKYVTSTTVSVNGGTAKNVSAVSNSEATLKITFSDDNSVSTEQGKFYAYDGSNTSNPPSGVTIYAFEVGNTSWTNCGGSSNALTLADHTTPAQNHYFYIGVSGTPTSVGTKTGKFRIELTYY